jgi:hypothetical protein
VAGSLPHDEADLSEVTAQRIDRWVLWRTNRSRVRETTAAPFASALFGRTNRIVGRCAASQIASASAMSFFCRFTNGFT